MGRKGCRLRREGGKDEGVRGEDPNVIWGRNGGRERTDEGEGFRTVLARVPLFERVHFDG